MNQIQIYDESNKKMAESFESLLTIGVDVAWDIAKEDIALLSKIPIASFVMSLLEVGFSWRDRYFIKKVSKFFYDLNNGNITEKDRDRFLNKYFGNEKEKERICELLSSSIDYTNDINKIDILTKITETLIMGVIDIDDFNRFVNIYNSINLDDIYVMEILYNTKKKDNKKIKNIKFGNGYSDSLKLGISRKLEILCVIFVNNNTCGSIGNIMEATIELTELGRKFCECVL